MVARAVVESASFPTTASINSYKNWSSVVHNVGDTGVFGIAIVNSSGPGSIVILWGGTETELPVSPTVGMIIYSNTEKPNCTRLSIDGQIKFKVAGNYTIYCYGAHQEGTIWVIDDTSKFFEVVVSTTPTGTSVVSGNVTGFLGKALAGATVKMAGLEATTDSSGTFKFDNIAIGAYTITVSKEPYYSEYSIKLAVNVAGYEYKLDISLAVKSYILYGVPIAAIVGVGGGVAYLRRPRK